MSCSVFTAHLDLEDNILVGALFLTYTLDLGAFEERILPMILPIRHPPNERDFSEEVRRRIAEVPIAVVADASCLMRPGAAASGGTCSVPVVRFAQSGGAFHPKLALLACKSRGIRVVIGSANLTEAGIARQIELVSSFWLDDHPSAAPGLRAVLRALERRLAKSPAYARAARVIERAFPKARGEETGPRVLCSTTPIFAQALGAIAADTGGKGQIDEVSVVSPFFERGVEDRSLFEQIDQQIRKQFPRSRSPRYVLRLPTPSAKAPYCVEAPVEHLQRFARQASFDCLVLTPERRAWSDDPRANDDRDRKDRQLHGKLITFRVRHGADSWVYTMLGSPNFTKAALLGANFEIALLQRAAKAPAGSELPAERIAVSELVEDARDFKSPPREVACIDRIVLTIRTRTLEVIAAEDAAIPPSLVIRAKEQPLAWQPAGPNMVVCPFEDTACTVVEVKLTDRWYPLPVEVVDPEVVPAVEAVALSLQELLERIVAHGVDPDAVGMSGSARTRCGTGREKGNSLQLASMSEVAPQLESICELAIAFETSLSSASSPEALLTRFRAYFAPALQALARAANSPQLRTHAFALLDIKRAADRLRRQIPAEDKARRAVAEQIRVECAELVARLERSSDPAGRSSIAALRRSFEAG